MDYTLPAILFVVGFSAAIAVRNLRLWMRGDRGLGKLPLENGAVRLDLVAGDSPKLELEAMASESRDAESQTAAPSDAGVAADRPRKRRPPLRKRRRE